MPSKLPPQGAENTLYLVDLSGYVFRAYHAVAPLSSPTGEPTAAVFGTLNMLEKVVRERKPSHVAIAMDSKTKTFRKDLDARYKANRPPVPPELDVQMARCEELVRAYNFFVLQKDGLEADDLIATAVGHAREANLQVVIVSADKDLMQLVDDSKSDVVLWDSMRNKVFGPEEVQEKFGVRPSQVRDFLALTGDSSDNVPGVRSVGPKTAKDLLHQFGTLHAIYTRIDEVSREKLKAALLEHKEDAFLSQTLVTLKMDETMPWNLEALRPREPHTEDLRKLFAELGFRRQLSQLGEPLNGGTPRAESASRSENGETSGQPSLFGGGGSPRRENTPPSLRGPGDHTLVTDLQALHRLLANAKVSRILAIHVLTMESEVRKIPDVIGIAISTEAGKAGYVPLSHRYLGAPAQLTMASVREALAPLLGDPSICKLMHDRKSVLTTFLAAPSLGTAIRLEEPVLDTEILSQLHDPSLRADVPTLAKRLIDFDLEVPDQTPAKKTRNVPSPLDTISVEEATKRFAPYADALARARSPLEAEMKSEGYGEIYVKIERPLTDVLFDMEKVGVLVDGQVLQTLSDLAETSLASLEKRAHDALGRAFSLRSRDQLEEILFDELKLPVIKKTAKGGRSTDHEVLEELSLDHALPKILLEYREVDKLKGTYLDALPRSISKETGRIHSTFSQIGAATGRIASNDPNLQNIPIRTELGRKIRTAFIAPPGKKIISADYSQIELRILAHLTQDPELILAFQRGDDVHAHTASLIFNVQRSEVTQEMRRRAKTINFGVMYGMGEVALAKGLDISRAEASSFIASYFKRYGNVRAWMDETIERARSGEAISTLYGRRRVLPNLRSPNRMLRAEAERMAKNTPVQGTAADVIKLAMLAFGKGAVPDAKMVLTVHDELLFEIDEARAAGACKEIQEVMQSVATLKVPLDVTAHFGDNWGAAHG